LSLFILQTFQVQDEEIQSLHLPVVFSAVMNVLNVSNIFRLCSKCVTNFGLQLHVQVDILRASTSTVREALLLQEEILQHVPLSALLKRPELTEGAQAATVSQSPYGFACTFYGIKPTSKLSIHKDSSSVPFASALGDVIGLSTSCGRSLLISTRPLALRGVFAQLLLLVGMLVDKLEGKQDAPIEVSWNPIEWLSIVLNTFELKVCFLLLLIIYLFTGSSLG
jgi:hypothetical protein